MSKAKVEWVEINCTGDKPVGRSSNVIGVVNSELYVFSGENVPREAVDGDVFVLNFAKQTWRKIPAEANWPLARVGHAATVVGTKLYVFGGRTGYDAGSKSLGDFWSFDSVESKWKQIDSGAVPPLSYHTMTNNFESIFLFGGCTVDHGRTSTIWEYKILENTWTLLCDSPVLGGPCGRGGSSVVYAADSSLHVAFGYNGKEELRDHFQFDLQTKKWTQVVIEQGKPIPPSRSVTDVVSLPGLKGGSLFVFGGEYTPSVQGHEGAGEYHRDSWIYNIQSKEWNKCDNTGNVPSARGWFNTAAVDSTSVVVFGGFDGESRIGDVYVGKVSCQ